LPRSLRVLLAYLAIPTLLLFNTWLFRAVLGIDYYGWYLDDGALIGVATGFIALIWKELEGYDGLVALNPVAYFGAALQVAGVLLYSAGTSQRAPIHRQVTEARSAWTRVGILWDAVASTGLGLMILVAVIIWIVVVMPMQWLVMVIAGAPIRRQLRDGLRRTVVERRGSQITTEPGAGQQPGGALIDVTLARKPFAVTQALIALVLFVLNAAWEWMT